MCVRVAFLVFQQKTSKTIYTINITGQDACKRERLRDLNTLFTQSKLWEHIVKTKAPVWLLITDMDTQRRKTTYMEIFFLLQVIAGVSTGSQETCH